MTVTNLLLDVNITFDPVKVLDYVCLHDSDELDPPGEEKLLIKLDSPGRSVRMNQYIYRLGASEVEQEGGEVLSEKQLQEGLHKKGLLMNHRQWYLGFASLLRHIHSKFGNNKQIIFLNNINDVLTFFSKSACHEKLSKHNIPVPLSLNHVSDFEELIAKMNRHNMNRVFIKSDHGSSASGIAALQINNYKMLLKTTMELVKENGQIDLYNSRKLQQYHDHESIKIIINRICSYGAHTEQWIPKANINGQNCDLRILIIDGDTTHLVLRKSTGPFTNLHLLNERDDYKPLKKKMKAVDWDKMIKTCEQTARIFPDSFLLSLDMTVTGNYKRHFILEINAFGDLLHQVYYHNLNPYEYQIKKIIAKFGCGHV